jgi:tryptophanyl-tRNA synthetase
MRERYNALMAEPAKIEALLRQRGQQLREQFAIPLLKQLREAVGLRDLSTIGQTEKAEAVAKMALPLFKQYREKDGRFYFKLLDGDGQLLIQSEGFDSPRDAGQLIAVLKQAEQGDALQSELFKVEGEVEPVLAALAALREAAAKD